MAIENTSHLEPHQKPSIHVTKRSDRSTLMLALHTILRPIGPKLIKPPKDPFPAGSPQLDPHKKAKKRCDISERKVEDIYLYDVRPKGTISEKTPAKRIYYFSGGGWQSPAASEHWSFVAEMAHRLPDTAVTLVSYPLAPKSSAPTAFPMLMRLYRTLMLQAQETGEKVILAGDSAGGNIVLSLVVNALQEEPESPCPTAILAISPSTDLRRANPDMPLIEKKDPILRIAFVNQTATAWRGDFEPCDVRVSPLYGDVTPLAKRGVKVHGVTGRYDILSPDGVLFREKLNQAWVQGEWLDWDKQMHVFPLAFAYKLKESVQAVDWIMDVLKNV
ncbi:Esterase [Pseudocercospora fuligena]|uniref:Esterase n=1 Tax=Pseudocercospora fuligena TaxID=685502 RepID=A0A8H6VN22_9PEZI|nr:Esterase [Pseudocercospora fuligena]